MERIDTTTHEYGYTPAKEAYLKRLRRIEGQVRGIQRMVEEDTYCIDVLTQVAAVNKALHAVALQLVEDHVRHCVVGAAERSRNNGEPEHLDEKLAEAMSAISRLVRS